MKKSHKHYHQLIMIWSVLGTLLVSWVGCSKPDQKDAGVTSRSTVERSRSQVGVYPFSVGFGATLQELIAAEGVADSTVNLDVMTTYEYVRQWQGLTGRLSYLYLKEEDAIVAISFDVPLGKGISLDDVMIIAEEIYAKPTPDVYVQFFELELSEAVRLYESTESQGFFWTDRYLIQVEEKPNAGVINVLYIYMHPNSEEHTHH
ncbi:hypothetical protein PVA44_00765 [Entomospira nematocerorum]|uniref:Lipoprotein n=1 Tax=Entomospira nematocerorum TaxID=2719987 RepID=A0A968KTI5_9SPIO|nr:hypothetical protein [Entomospira nematocera]NIZ47431.1 hypothetical protein [Entomospira nematocera]WDI34031.1 hypothetical protein PVA44_00765 [Entomospira nematocera]